MRANQCNCPICSGEEPEVKENEDGTVTMTFSDGTVGHAIKSESLLGEAFLAVTVTQDATPEQEAMIERFLESAAEGKPKQCH